jgi:hypothetical protein
VNRWSNLAVLFFARTAMGFQFQSIAAVSASSDAVSATSRGCVPGLRSWRSVRS